MATQNYVRTFNRVVVVNILLVLASVGFVDTITK